MLNKTPAPELAEAESNNKPKTLAERFFELFASFNGAHGRYDVRRKDEKGKAEGKASTIKGPIRQDLVDDHLAGKGAGLGGIPLKEDNTLDWAVIDVDVYGVDHGELEKKIKALRLPLVICRSKSGGAHCFVFFKEPEPASEVVPILASYAALLGHGGCEIFPKQTTRYNLDEDLGNWLNMPYYQAETTTRSAIRDGQDLTLEQFLDYAEASKTTLEEMRAVEVGGDDADGPFAGGPPCLQTIHANGGFPSGTRNDGMYNVGVYLKKRFPDTWEAKLFEYNDKVCDPPLASSEIQALAKSIKKKTYCYRCKLPPIKPHCN